MQINTLVTQNAVKLQCALNSVAACTGTHSTEFPGYFFGYVKFV